MSFSVTLVGTRGRMGAMFLDCWSKTRPVHAVNRAPDGTGNRVFREDDLAAAVPRGDVVMLCVPAPAMPETLAAVLPHMRETQLLTDVCSVKVNPMRWMREAFAGPVIGTHPLFGPENEHKGARVALVRGHGATDAHMTMLTELFREMGCVLFETTAEAHDRAAGISQSLHFALAAAYFAMAAREKDLEQYITPSFLRWRDAARNELTANAPMFGEFTRANPLFPGVLAELAETLREAGVDGLDALAKEARAWYA